MEKQVTYWFPAKTYGWGWGVPSAWQGWVVLGVAAMLFVLGVVVIDPRTQPLLFAAVTIGISIVLVAICMAKGEPPRWRWGDK